MNTAAAIRRVAVLGAGVMGAQIAAHLANAGVPVVLFDLSAGEGDPSGIAAQAIANLVKLNPAPLTLPERADGIQPANYDQHLERLRDCDVWIEAIAERPDWKAALYQRVTPYLNERAILATNTSGLPLALLAEAAPDQARSRFCGVHFFNPPRYMPLVELIPGPTTDPAVLDLLETFLVSTLGKGVVRAKDTPNFIANRIGVFSMAVTMHHTQALGLGLDLVDALTGPAIGRARSATYRTLDLIGLDTMDHVFQGAVRALPHDPWRDYYRVPVWLHTLIEQGALGQKTGVGFYAAKGQQVFDPVNGAYRSAAARPDPTIQAILNIKAPGEQFAALRASPHPQAQLLWAIQRDVFHYAAVLLAEIADSARAVDLAMRWGYGWSQGPFELWQAAGWRQVAAWIGDDIATGQALTTTPLPTWVDQIEGVHQPQGSYSAAAHGYQPRSSLPVYQRQLYPELVRGEAPHRYGETVFETDGVRLWTMGDDIGVVSFTSQRRLINAAVLAGLRESLRLAETRFIGLVWWQTAAPFSAGTELTPLPPLMQAGDDAALNAYSARLQQTASALRDAAIPVVGAVQGLALDGACQLLLHCDRVVAAQESQIGLTEISGGLPPAGGACRELATRAALAARGGDPLPFLAAGFEAMILAKVSRSAEEARQLGYLRFADPIVFNPHELLYVAKVQVRALAETGYRPPLSPKIRVAGRDGVAACRKLLAKLRDHGSISAHDATVGLRVATVLCGGELDPGARVEAAQLLEWERRAFVELARNPLTQERIEHLLKTGKPLRN